MLEFRILGPLEVVDAAGPLRLGGARQRALLAMLLLRAGRLVTIDALIDAFYGSEPPASAVTQVHRHVSELRRVLGPTEAIETVPDGYMLAVRPEGFDLPRFEALTAEGEAALRGGDADRARTLLRSALGMWRGDPLADLAAEPALSVARRRLTELRLATTHAAIDAEISSGRHRQAVAELVELADAWPLDERFRRQLMLALYRSGRQVEALDIYQDTRRRLVDGLGLEPTPALQELHRQILAHDPALDDPGQAGHVVPTSVLTLVSTRDDNNVVSAYAGRIAHAFGHELLVIRFVEGDDEVSEAAVALSTVRAGVQAPVRIAAFVSDSPAEEVRRLEEYSDVRLIVVPGRGRSDDKPPFEVQAIIADARADVAVAFGRPRSTTAGAAVDVLFGGTDDDWAALELAAWLARADHLPLTLVGVRGDAVAGRRGASRLLADASLVVQRLVAIEATPRLVDPDVASTVNAVAGAALVVAGLGRKWSRDQPDPLRAELVRRIPTLLLHRGARPSAFAPPEATTQFGWTIGA